MGDQTQPKGSESPPEPTMPPIAAGEEHPLEYEETPIIEPIKEEESVPKTAPPPEPFKPPPPPHQPPGLIFGSRLGKLIFFAILFAIGVWLSTILRQFVPSGIPQLSLPKPQPQVKTTPTSLPAPPEPTDPFADWKTYYVISAVTRGAIDNISFKLPPEILPPVCDGPSCVSQGTYLPGGTRFTVAARGTGQALPDYRGALLTDVSGRAFATKEATVAGFMATEFRGEFTGITVGGYAFTQMRGVMLGINEKLALEINHFAPSGISSDFVADEALFDKILKTLEFTWTGQGQEKGTIPTP